MRNDWSDLKFSPDCFIPLPFFQRSETVWKDDFAHAAQTEAMQDSMAISKALQLPLTNTIITHILAKIIEKLTLERHSTSG